MESNETLDRQLIDLATAKNLDAESARALVDEFRSMVTLDEAVVAEAMSIEVTDETQVDLMDKARELRLDLREQRIAIDKLRKARKEHHLRVGQAIDGVANHLRDLIQPIEDHLKTQEKFVELKREAEEAARREAAEAALREKEEREAEAARKAAEEAAKAAIAEAEAKRKAAEKKAREESKKRRELEREQRQRQEAEAAMREKERQEHQKELEAARAEAARLAAMVKCPDCGKVFDGREHHAEQ